MRCQSRVVREELSLIGDAESGQAEAGGGDAGHAAWVAAAVQIIACAVEDLAGFVACLLPEEETRPTFKIVEEGFVSRFGLPLIDDVGAGEGRKKRAAAGCGDRFSKLATIQRKHTR